MFYEVLLFPHNNVMDLNNVSCMDVCQVKLLHLNANWMNVFFFVLCNHFCFCVNNTQA